MHRLDQVAVRVGSLGEAFEEASSYARILSLHRAPGQQVSAGLGRIDLVHIQVRRARRVIGRFTQSGQQGTIEFFAPPGREGVVIVFKFEEGEMVKRTGCLFRHKTIPLSSFFIRYSLFVI